MSKLVLNDWFSKLKILTKESAISLLDDSNKLVQRALDKYICIGVSGFSGSGKSTFITSLIHHLRYSNESQLHGFLPARDQKILDVKLLPLPDCELFDYQKAIQSLASEPPQWPQPTATLSGCIIQISYKSKASLSNKVFGNTRILNVEIRDYPGEWLVDLPLIDEDYWSWCQDQNELSQQPARKQLMGDLLQQLQDINPFSILTDNEINALFVHYTDYLKQCKQHGLTLIQPGRFLLPDSAQSSPAFFPLLGLRQYDKERLAEADENTLYKVMQRHYESYITNIVTPFRNDFFNKIDRQVVLIDLLKALSGGESNFEDMMLALSRIMGCYHYGINNYFNKLTSPDIERIVFLASKPDRVLSSQHENLRSLVNDIIRRVSPQSVRNAIPIDTEVVCSVRCTQDHDQFLTGMSIDGQKGKLKHPLISETIPTQEQWKQYADWQLTELRPPSIAGLMQGARLPSIRIDTVLKDLIGDKF